MSQWENVMAKHAKSFHLASLFFPKRLLPKVKALYALCRWLDDAVDEAPNQEMAKSNLLEIEQDLHAQNSKMPVNILYKENELDVGYIDDLILGAQFDLEVVRIQSKEELIQYAYKVAGTVGLAMFDLMQIPSAKARAHAVDLGVAMQITNICRDIKEDLERGRIYVPIQLLNRYQISEDDFIQGHYRPEQLSFVTKDLLALADRYYLSAQQAFPAIPWRTRGAIIIASQLYRGIGLKLLRKGANPMRGRTYLTTTEKIMVVTKGLFTWFFSYTKPSLQHDASLHKSLKPWQELRGFQA